MKTIAPACLMPKGCNDRQGQKMLFFECDFHVMRRLPGFHHLVHDDSKNVIQMAAFRHMASFFLNVSQCHLLVA
jgi:hypothetical protein